MIFSTSRFIIIVVHIYVRHIIMHALTCKERFGEFSLSFSFYFSMIANKLLYYNYYYLLYDYELHIFLLNLFSHLLIENIIN